MQERIESASNALIGSGLGGLAEAVYEVPPAEAPAATPRS